MSFFDYVMMIGYLLFMPLIGLLFKRMSRDASDFYRGGGSIQWWLSGASIVVASFSAFSFTGGASKAYLTGFVLPLAYLTAIIGLIPLYYFLAARFRQMRVVTVCQAVRRRYGRTTEQFWVWTQMPISVFYSGLALMTVSIFIGSAMNIDTRICIVALGLAVLLMTVAGGEWSVQSSDFLQLAIILVVTSIVAIRALAMPEIGGVSGLIDKMPSRYWDWSEFSHTGIVWAWLGTFVLFNLVNSANISAVGARYLSVRDGKHARKAVLMQIVFSLIMPLLFFIPAFVGAILYPDLSEMFPQLKVPSEGVYLAVAQSVLPQGALGLMVCCVFAATMSTLDTGLNRTSGFIVVNVYEAYIRPDASPQQQMRVGRITTLLLGIVMMGIALLLNARRELNLFDFVILLGGLIATPQIVPMVLGMFIKGTPGWSGWSTVVVGLCVSFSVKFGVDPAWVAGIFGIEDALTLSERADIQFIMITGVTLLACLAYFFTTMLFYDKAKVAVGADVDDFFKDMEKPINHEEEGTPDNERQQCYLIGLTLLLFGSFVVLGILIPNQLNDRLIFLVGGGAIALVGAFFYARGRGKASAPSTEA